MLRRLLVWAGVIGLILAMSLVGCRGGETPTPTIQPTTSPLAELTPQPSPTLLAPTTSPLAEITPEPSPTLSAPTSPVPELKETVLVPITAEVERATPSTP